jgi:hypothetical protein
VRRVELQDSVSCDCEDKEGSSKIQPGVFDLKRAILNNLYYLEYAEFPSKRALLHHLQSSEFHDFAEVCALSTLSI